VVVFGASLYPDYGCFPAAQALERLLRSKEARLNSRKSILRCRQVFVFLWEGLGHKQKKALKSEKIRKPSGKRKAASF